MGSLKTMFPHRVPVAPLNLRSQLAPVGRFAPACGGHQGLLKRMGYTTFFESPAPHESISKELLFHTRDHKGRRAKIAVSLRS